MGLRQDGTFLACIDGRGAWGGGGQLKDQHLAAAVFALKNAGTLQPCLYPCYLLCCRRRCREKRMQEKQLVQQQALEQAKQNERLRAQVRPLMFRCTEGPCAGAAAACHASTPTTNIFLDLVHHLWIHALCLCAECCAWSQTMLPSMTLLPSHSNSPRCPSNLSPPLSCLQMSGLSQRCDQEQSFRQELRGSLQALAHSIGAAPVSPAMELCQDFLGRERRGMRAVGK